MFSCYPPTINTFHLKDLFSCYSKIKNCESDVIRRLQKFFGRKNILLTGNGRTALYLALLEFKGKTVAMPAFTCPIVFDTIVKAGCKPLLVDIELETFNIDPSKIPESAEAVVAVHSYGVPFKVKEILKQGKPVIEDCALGFGSKYKEKIIGTFGDYSFFSFSFGKNFGIRNGGILLVKSKSKFTEFKKILSTMPQLKFGFDAFKTYLGFRLLNKYTYKLLKKFPREPFKKSDFGRISDIDCAIFLNQLNRWEEIEKIRSENLKILTKELKDNSKVVLPKVKGNKVVTAYFPILLKNVNRDKMLTEMAKKGICFKPRFPFTVPAAKKMKTKRFKNADYFSKNYLEIPLTIKVEEFEKIASIINKILEKF